MNFWSQPVPMYVVFGVVVTVAVCFWIHGVNFGMDLEERVRRLAKRR